MIKIAWPTNPRPFRGPLRRVGPRAMAPLAPWSILIIRSTMTVLMNRVWYCVITNDCLQTAARSVPDVTCHAGVFISILQSWSCFIPPSQWLEALSDCHAMSPWLDIVWSVVLGSICLQECGHVFVGYTHLGLQRFCSRFNALLIFKYE